MRRALIGVLLLVVSASGSLVAQHPHSSCRDDNSGTAKRLQRRQVLALPPRPPGCVRGRSQRDDRDANGDTARETWTADPKAPIDCFYVYPTVSTDPTPYSDMTADPAELNVIRQQFARFASKCRPYAPLYRQVTLAGLRRMLGGGGAGALSTRRLDTTMCAMRGTTISSTTTAAAASCSSATRRARSSSPS